MVKLQHQKIPSFCHRDSKPCFYLVLQRVASHHMAKFCVPLKNISNAFAGSHFHPKYFCPKSLPVKILGFFSRNSSPSITLVSALEEHWVGDVGPVWFLRRTATLAQAEAGLCLLAFSCSHFPGGSCASVAISGSSTWTMLPNLPSSWARNGIPAGTSRKCQRMPSVISASQGWDRRQGR